MRERSVLMKLTSYKINILRYVPLQGHLDRYASLCADVNAQSVPQYKLMEVFWFLCVFRLKIKYGVISALCNETFRDLSRIYYDCKRFISAVQISSIIRNILNIKLISHSFVQSLHKMRLIIK